MVLYLSEAEVGELLSPREALDAIEACFIRLARGVVENRTRTRIPLEDGVFVRTDWIGDEANQDIAKRFLKATFKGWVYCRDNFEQCLQIVLDNGPTLGEGHQRWQLNEINKLIWPNELGIGIMDPESFETTKQIASSGSLLTIPTTRRPIAPISRRRPSRS